MFKLLIFIYLNGVLIDVSDEGLFGGYECEELGTKMVYINEQIDTHGIDLVYRCARTS